MPPSPSRNFAFLGHHDPRLVVLTTQAEAYFADDPSTCLIKLRQFGEALAQRVAAKVGLYTSADENQLDLLNRLRDRGALSVTVRDLFHGLRRAGNEATHAGKGDHSEGLHQLKMARELAVWFQRSFGNNRAFDPGPFVPPPEPAKESAALAAELERLRAVVAEKKSEVDAAEARAAAETARRQTAEQRAEDEARDRAIYEALASEAGAKHAAALALADQAKATLAAELAAVQAAVAAAPAAATQKVVDIAAEVGDSIALDEAATRRIIDAQLRQAGWEANTETLTYALGVRPQKGKDIAIAEWPTASGPVDYALFRSLEAIGVVEAKRRNLDVAGVIEQAKRYSRGFSFEGGAVAVGTPWGQHRVPFVFATNGRPYLKQVETKSGIWSIDARKPENLARALPGWYRPEGLTDLLKRDVDAANERLAHEPTAYLGLRDYQLRAIRSVEDALAAGKRTCLVAMATGTGKTKTAIGLAYRLVKSGRFKRILFLVDRSALGEQTGNAFKETRLEGLRTFTEIFDLKEQGDVEPESDTKVHIATVQGMVRRILYAADDAEAPTVDTYDCVVVDECHRGYGLDREMGDAEMQFRDLEDYISKYRRVLDYFDAVKIGLTATPALHTTQIFGEPTFKYGYREAVIDGWLVDHEPPHQIVTRLAEAGITFDKGEQVSLFDQSTGVIDHVHLPDEMRFEVDSFNRKVVTESFNRVVCEELARHIDPSLPIKTLIFCATDAHADLVVKLLKDAFATAHGSVADDAVVKITGASDKPLQLIRRYKNERWPNVAVTVDLLTTGIDVPAIGNLVFLRRVRSRILYEQMLGRATRRCDAIGKEVFHIFDPVRLYEALEAVTDMKPVVQSVSITLAQLVQELTTLTDETAREQVLEQIVAKLQRKGVRLKGEDLERFEGLAGGAPRDVARILRSTPPAEAAAWFAKRAYLVSLVDRAGTGGGGLFLSEHDDTLIRVDRGYGNATKPDDYLSSFTAFVRDNMNRVPALTVVAQRPRELTRAQLRELALLLDEKGYNEASLQTAWREKTNADIAASIIGFVRQAAVGDPLVPYDERVARALQAVRSSRPFTEPQRKWLERIGLAMKVDRIVDQAALDRGQFAAEGGFARLNKVFDGRLEQILGDLTEAAWAKLG